MSPRRIERVLGVEVDVVTMSDLAEQVIGAVCSRSRLWVAHHNLHSAYLVLDDERMQDWFRRADLTFVDGMSLVVASRLGRGTLRRAHRATLLDWLPSVLDAAARDGRSVFHLGGDPAWIDRGAEAWRARHPGLQVEVHHGYFEDGDDERVVRAINASSPDLLLVGLGMPRQERWLAENCDALEVPVIMNVGAFLGYAAGATAQPPRWTGRVGLEWAWRLVADPRRLARRYLIEPVLLARALGARRRARR